jgi:ABC-2 type transport system permease protein
MWMICKKEWQQFFSNLTGYIIITVFLVVNGLALFVFENNIFSFGYATLEKFFLLAPWILLLLIPAVTMRSFPDEFKTGTYEVLKTLPLSSWQIILGKYVGNLLVVFMALLPTFIYIISIQQLAVGDGLDMAATTGAYIGLFFLAAVFTAIGIYAGSFTNNAVVAFVISLIACALLYYGFNATSKLPIFTGGIDYYLEMAGIDFHYSNISKGVIDSRDIIYFLSIILLLLILTMRNLANKKS